jgi:hypothetical protein
MPRKIFWEEVRVQVARYSPELAEIIDELSPGKDHYFYEENYPYSAVILDRSIFQVSNTDQQIVPLNHPSIAKNIQEDLGYSGTIPMGLVLENSIETFMCASERVVPFSLYRAGDLISLWRVLDQGHSYHAGRFWNVTSGARSICMIPKITDTSSHKILKPKFKLKTNVPRKLRDHWELFSQIANHPNFPQPWKSTLLYFPKNWFEHQKDPRWIRFYYFLFNRVWQSSAFLRNQFIIDFAFSNAQQNKNLRPNPYLADTVRHLIAIGSGSVPGFSPALDDTAAPISGLQQVYLDDYGLKKYAPVVVHLHHCLPGDSRVVYYSFQIPTISIFSPKSRKASSAMVELQEVKYIMEVLLSEILRGSLEVENTPLFDLAKNVQYQYYHSERDKVGEILPASDIMNIDSGFTKTVINNDQYTFPEFSPFFKGCISIKSNESGS